MPLGYLKDSLQTCHSSCCSESTELTSAYQRSSVGNLPTTFVLLLIFSLRVIVMRCRGLHGDHPTPPKRCRLRQCRFISDHPYAGT